MLGYLGRVYKIDKINDPEFHEFLPKTSKPKQLITNLIKWELHKHGFKEISRQNINLKQYMKPNTSLSPTYQKLWIKDRITAIPERGEISVRSRPCVLHINDNHMCERTLKKLLKFKSDGDQEAVAVDLAEAFVTAGIKIPQENFIELFQQIFNKKETRI